MSLNSSSPRSAPNGKRAATFAPKWRANNSGIRRLNSLVEQVGLAQASFYMDRLIDYTKERTLSELAKLPKGEFTAVGVVDNDGFTDEPVRLQVRIVIDDEGVLFDLTGCDPQRRAPVNSTYSQTFAACAYVLKCLIDQDVPVNAGFYAQVRLVAPEGTVVNCTAPSPVVWGWGDPGAADRYPAQGTASGAAR